MFSPKVWLSCTFSHKRILSDICVTWGKIFTFLLGDDLILPETEDRFHLDFYTKSIVQVCPFREHTPWQLTFMLLVHSKQVILITFRAPNHITVKKSKKQQHSIFYPYWQLQCVTVMAWRVYILYIRIGENVPVFSFAVSLEVYAPSSVNWSSVFIIM